MVILMQVGIRPRPLMHLLFIDTIGNSPVGDHGAYPSCKDSCNRGYISTNNRIIGKQYPILIAVGIQFGC